MGCGGSAEIIPPVEDPKEGETLATVKELKMYEDTKAEKVIAVVPPGKPMTVLGTEVTEGPSFTGFIRATGPAFPEGYIALWQCEVKTAPGGGGQVKGPKSGCLKRPDAAAGGA